MFNIYGVWCFVPSTHIVYPKPSFWQEQAKADAEKVQKAEAKKLEKERLKEEKAKAKEDKKRLREEEKQKKLAEKEQKKRKVKGDDVNTAAAGAVGGEGDVAVEIPGSPKTPTKRSAAAMVATPRQKEMLKRTRAKVAETTETAGSHAEKDEKAKSAKDAAMHAKVHENYELLRGLPEFSADCSYFPSFDNNPDMKSFTVNPYGELQGSKKSIGAVLFRTSFYVYKANIPEGFQELLTRKGVKAHVHADAHGGCSLGWKRFQSLKQACPI